MEVLACSSCQKTKSLLQCGYCECSVCKNCAEFLAEDAFQLLLSVPAEHKHSVYCQSCYRDQVEGQLVIYRETLEKAKDIMIFDKSQGKETRLVKRDEDKIQIPKCADYDEVIMKLAFKAVQMNYNAVVDVDVRSEKVRIGAYQTQVFSGSGIPAFFKTSQIVKDRSIWSAPN